MPDGVKDATCVDTFAPSYQNLAVTVAGAVACKKESLKEEKYANLSHTHFFVPVAIETAGIFGSHTLSVIKVLGNVYMKAQEITMQPDT